MRFCNLTPSPHQYWRQVAEPHNVRLRTDGASSAQTRLRLAVKQSPASGATPDSLDSRDSPQSLHWYPPTSHRLVSVRRPRRCPPDVLARRTSPTPTLNSAP